MTNNGDGGDYTLGIHICIQRIESRPSPLYATSVSVGREVLKNLNKCTFFLLTAVASELVNVVQQIFFNTLLLAQ